MSDAFVARRFLDLLRPDPTDEERFDRARPSRNLPRLTDVVVEPLDDEQCDLVVELLAQLMKGEAE